MAGASDQTVFDMIRKSNAYKAIDYRDKAKVELALNNKPSKRPSSWIGQAAWELARRDTVGPPAEPPPIPPPIAYKLVAPRVAYKAGGSDARYCCVNQPGVLPAGAGWRDDVATYDDNGLCTSGTRADGPAMTSALEIDGRDYCSLPTTGSPELNTGSWAI